MPYKNKEEQKKCQQKHYEKNVEIIKERATEYNRTNKEKRHRTRTKSQWNMRGVVSDNYDDLYDYYMKTKNCELCSIELTIGKRTKTSKCLDHCHETGQFRNIVCHSCNCKFRTKKAIL